MHLILDLPTGDSTAAWAWRLLDREGRVLREGRSPLGEVPHAERVTATLPANHVLFTELKLPPVSPARLATLLPFAIEDKLMSDPGDIVALAGSPRGEGLRVVAVVDRPWLSRMLGLLSAAGLRPDAVVPQSELVPRAPGEWTALLPPGEREGVLVRDDGFAIAFDVTPESEPPLAVVLALKEAGQRAPTRMTALAAQAAEVEGWSARLGLPVRWQAPHLRLDRASEFNFLLHAELRRHGRVTGWQARGPLLRPVAWAAGAVLGFHFVALAFDVWQLSGRAAQLRDEQTTLFRSAFPEARAVVDAPLQMSRNLAQLKRDRGEGSDPLIGVLARLQDWLAPTQGRVESLRFSQRRLTADLRFEGTPDSASLPAGWRFTPRAGGGVLTLELDP